MLMYLSLDITCSSKLFGTNNVLLHYYYTNRYPYIFLRKIEVIVYLWSLTGFIPTYDSTSHIVLLWKAS